MNVIRKGLLGSVAVVATWVLACSTDTPKTPDSGLGGQAGSKQGGAGGSGGSGGSISGGGSPNGGSSTVGGSFTGGSSVGGSSMGGATTGGSSNGGTNSGGSGGATSGTGGGGGAAGGTGTPGSQAVVNALSFDQFKQTLKTLGGFGDRRAGSKNQLDAASWIDTQLSAVGYAPERHKYKYQNQDRENLYATKVGTESPDSMYIISGHQDGLGNGGAVDDDGSGVAAVLECARALAQANLKTNISVRFIFWNDEETGLNGSAAYINERRDLQGKEEPPGSGKYPEPKWLGVIQHDMILFDHGVPPQANQIPGADIDIEYLASSKLASGALALANALKAGSGKFALKYPAQVGAEMSNTDSMSFEALSPSVSMRENQRLAEIGKGANPHWHKATDVYETYSEDDFRLGFDVTRTTCGTIAELVGAKVNY